MAGQNQGCEPDERGSHDHAPDEVVAEMWTNNDFCCRHRGRTGVTQAHQEIGGTTVTIARGAGDGLAHDGTQVRSETRTKARRWDGLINNLRVHVGEKCFPGKWEMPSQHLIEHQPSRIDIRANVAALASELFRRKVVRRAHHRLRLSAPGYPALRAVSCNAEIDELDGAIRGYEDILRLDVAVDYPLLVEIGERRTELACNVQGTLDGQGSGSE